MVLFHKVGQIVRFIKMRL